MSNAKPACLIAQRIPINVMSRKEKRDLAEERIQSVFPEVCATVLPSLPRLMTATMTMMSHQLSETGGPHLCSKPDISVEFCDGNRLKVSVDCWLDYGGVQGRICMEDVSSLGHISFTQIDSARRRNLHRTICQRVRHLARAIYRTIPPCYPSLKRGDKSFESCFSEVTYKDFGQRIKYKDVKRLLYQVMTGASKKSEEQLPSLSVDFRVRAEQWLTHEIADLFPLSPAEGWKTPIDLIEVMSPTARIMNDMSVQITAQVKLDCTNLCTVQGELEVCTIEATVAEPLPYSFALMSEGDAASALKICLRKGLEELCWKLGDLLTQYQEILCSHRPIETQMTDASDKAAASVEPTGAGNDQPRPAEKQPAVSEGTDSASEASKRRKTERSFEKKLIQAHHKETSRHVLKVEADVSRSDAMRIFRLSDQVRKFKNKLVEKFKSGVDKLRADEEYLDLKKKYHELAEKIKKLKDKTSEEQKLKKELRSVADTLNQKQAEAGLTKELLESEQQQLRTQFQIPSVFAKTASEDVWRAIEAVFYRGGRKLHFSKYGEYPMLRAKQTDGEIHFRVIDGQLFFDMNILPEKQEQKPKGNELMLAARREKLQRMRGEVLEKQKKGDQLSQDEVQLLCEDSELPLLTASEKTQVRSGMMSPQWPRLRFGLRYKQDDRFVQDELSRVIYFLKHPEMELSAACRWKSTGTPQDTFRPCYAALSCERIRGKYRVFVHITIEGKPCDKFRKDGSLRHRYGFGRIGADIGTQSVGSVSNSKVRLENLAERNGESTFASERKQKEIQRSLSRSLREMNPENYNEDKTAKNGKKSWKYSRNGKKAKKALHEIERKNALSREYAINQMAWEFRAEANEMITEPTTVKAWQASGKAKRKREREEAEKKAAQKPDQQNAVVQVDADEVRKSEQGNSAAQSGGNESKDSLSKKKTRKRGMGRSIKNRCPGGFYAKCKEVFESTGGKFVTVSKEFRASQYDFELDRCIKKKLSQRWHYLGPAMKKIQRDIYSAFLMYCSNDTYTMADRTICFARFDEFWEKHNQTIQRIVDDHRVVCNSGI